MVCDFKWPVYLFVSAVVLNYKCVVLLPALLLFYLSRSISLYDASFVGIFLCLSAIFIKNRTLRSTPLDRSEVYIKRETLSFLKN